LYDVCINEKSIDYGVTHMVQARLEVSAQYNIRELAHSINNRMNAISLAMAILQQNDSPDVRVIATAMKGELRDLEQLINELKHNV
jgi:signal transduction histidine kinase